jgi:hypothetical protein
MTKITDKGESRGIDASHVVVQVLAEPLEPKLCENGEDRACHCVSEDGRRVAWSGRDRGDSNITQMIRGWSM